MYLFGTLRWHISRVWSSMVSVLARPNEPDMPYQKGTIGYFTQIQPKVSVIVVIDIAGYQASDLIS